MRAPAIVLAGLLSTAVAAHAEVPQSVVSLLGPSLAHLLAQSDLCGWNLGAKIEATYKDGFRRTGLTEAQQAAVWEQARFARQGMLSAPDAAKARMKSEMCTPAIRARVDRDLAN